MQIHYKQTRQKLEIAKAHEKYETNSIFIPKEILSFKKVLRQAYAQYFCRIKSYIVTNST